SPSSPSPPAAFAPPSPGFGPFFLHAPASGRIRRMASATRDVDETLMPTTFRLRSGRVRSFQPRRPGGRSIIPRPTGQLFLGLSVAIREEKMRVPAGARRREDEVATVGRPRRVLVAARRRDGVRAAP